MATCKHGIEEGWCALCEDFSRAKAKKEIKYPAKEKQDNQEVEWVVREEFPKKPEAVGYLLVRTYQRKNPNRCGLNELDWQTTIVHIDGFPFLWAIEEILKRAHNLKTVEVIPGMMRCIGPRHRELCNEKGIAIKAGYYRPDLVWKEGEIRSLEYKGNYSFFHGLEGKQKEKFEELLSLGFTSAQITTRYYCLSGEDLISQYELGRKFGYGGTIANNISRIVNSIRYYLDPEFNTGEASKVMANALKGRVSRLRKLQQSEELRHQYAQQIGVDSLPERLSLAQLDAYTCLVKAKREGRLDGFKNQYPKIYQVLIFFFGLQDSAQGVCLTLNEIGEKFGFTRERARQLKDQGLKILGILEDSEINGVATEESFTEDVNEKVQAEVNTSTIEGLDLFEKQAEEKPKVKRRKLFPSVLRGNNSIARRVTLRVSPNQNPVPKREEVYEKLLSAASKGRLWRDIKK